MAGNTDIAQPKPDRLARDENNSPLQGGLSAVGEVLTTEMEPGSVPNLGAPRVFVVNPPTAPINVSADPPPNLIDAGKLVLPAGTAVQFPNLACRVISILHDDGGAAQNGNVDPIRVGKADIASDPDKGITVRAGGFSSLDLVNASQLWVLSDTAQTIQYMISG